jgi:hypothetical protein
MSFRNQVAAWNAFKKAKAEGRVRVVPTMDPSVAVSESSLSNPVTSSQTTGTVSTRSPMHSEAKAEKRVDRAHAPSPRPVAICTISSDESDSDAEPVRSTPVRPLKKSSSSAATPTTRTSDSHDSSYMSIINSSKHLKTPSTVAKRSLATDGSSSPETGVTQYGGSFRSSASNGVYIHNLAPAPEFRRTPRDATPSHSRKPLQFSHTYPSNSPIRDKEPQQSPSKRGKGKASPKSSLSTTTPVPPVWDFNSEETPIYVIDSDCSTEPDTDEEITHRPQSVRKQRTWPQKKTSNISLLSPLDVSRLQLYSQPETTKAAESISALARSRANTPLSTIVRSSSVVVHDSSFDPRSPVSGNIVVSGRVK